MTDQDTIGRKNGKGGAGKAKALRTVRARYGADGGASRGSLYEEVTAKIIAQLEAGCFPWAQPWNAATAVAGLPRNAVTGRAYSGVNVLILWGAVIEGGYPSQDWLTFRQALAAGGCVRKGERGHTVFYADRFTPENESEKVEADSSEARSIPFLKRFVVFNAAQCDGLPQRLTAAGSRHTWWCQQSCADAFRHARGCRGESCLRRRLLRGDSRGQRCARTPGRH